jgi:hypothetical protein
MSCEWFCERCGDCLDCYPGTCFNGGYDNGDHIFPEGYLESKRVCVFCGMAYEDHEDGTDLNLSGVVPRMPCLGLKSGFAWNGQGK